MAHGSEMANSFTSDAAADLFGCGYISSYSPVPFLKGINMVILIRSVCSINARHVRWALHCFPVSRFHTVRDRSRLADFSCKHEIGDAPGFPSAAVTGT